MRKHTYNDASDQKPDLLFLLSCLVGLHPLFFFLGFYLLFFFFFDCYSHHFIVRFFFFLNIEKTSLLTLHNKNKNTKKKNGYNT